MLSPHLDRVGVWVRAVVALCVLLMLPAVSSTAFAQGAALWTTHCSGCHGAAPVLPQRNGAGATSVLNFIFANDGGTGMSDFRSVAAGDGVNGGNPLSPTDRSNIATYIATVFSATHATSVNYNSSVAVNFNNIGLNTNPTNALTSAQTVTAPASPNTVSYSTTQVTYTHNATNCNADAVVYRGTGGGGARLSSNRTLNITVNAPPIPTISSSTTAAANWNTNTAIPVTVSNAGTSFPTSISITTGANNGGTTTPVSTTSITYRSSTTNFFATETFSYVVNGPCGNQSAVINMTVNVSLPAPVFTSAATANGNGGQAFSHQLTANNMPANVATSFALAPGSNPLPSGVTINAAGLISGTPTANGTFNVTVRATNPTGNTDQALTINLTALTPVITSANTATGNGGQAFSYQITATNVPTSFSVTGTLPNGVTVNPTSGLISGTPTQNGTFNVTVNATNAAGTGSQALTITLTALTPAITSANTAAGNGGQAFSYQITATNVPTSFSVTGTLPNGVTVNPTSGLISGTPTQNGTFNVTVNATNAAGTGSQALTITLTALTPAITSANTAAGNGGQAFSYQITATNVPTSFSVTGTLPNGVTVNPTSGLISGTPTQTGTFNVTVNATNAAGTGSQALAITITLVAPVITSPNTASGNGGQAFSYQIVAGNLPASYSVTGTLPAGVTVNPTTGLISGIPGAGGVFNVTINATNAAGTGSQPLAITISTVAPVITSANTASGNGGQAFSYTITADNLPTSFSVTGTLPNGVTVNTTNGVISGTPTQTGTFNVTINAINGAGTGSQALAITINLVAPVITSANTASGNGGQAFNYTITAGNLPASYSVTGTLPAGVTVNPTTGLISGTPTQTGTFNVTINATNGAGTGSQALAITINLVAPVVTSATTAAGSGGQPFSYTITAGNLPASYSVTGTLPGGVTVNPTSGVISGTPTQNGVFNVTVNAINAAGTGSQALTITLTALVPAITSATTAAGNGGQPFNYQITATNVPTSFSVTGTLPAGVTVNPTSGLISGTPTQNGTFNVTVNATNAAGTGSRALAITLSAVVPAITSAATATGSGGQPFSYQITATNVPTSFSVTGTLPAGVTVNPASGLISGTPTQIGTFNVTVNAINAAGTGSRAVAITISPIAPVVTSAATAGGSGGVPFSYQITASNLPTAFSVTGTLPAGVTVNAATGLISGTPTQNGTFNVTVNATNGGGTGSQALAITLTAIAPVITSPATAAGQSGVPFSYTIAANNVPTSFAANGLPPGVSVNTATGLISGTPTVNGTFPATIEATNGAGTASRTLTITIAIASLPTAAAVTMNVPLNQATTLDLTASISGFSVTGIRIVTAPTIGSVTVNGRQVTYTPRTDYFGADSFTYSAFNQGGESAPALVSVVIGQDRRPDPTQQQNVVGTIGAQVQAAQRFARTQISNFSRRLESLHRGARPQAGQAQAPSNVASTTAPGAADPFAEVAANEARGANDGRGTSRGAHAPASDSGRSAPAAFGQLQERVSGGLNPIAQMAAAGNTSAGTSDARTGPLAVGSGALASDLVAVLTSRALNLAQLTGSGATAQTSGEVGGTDFWVEGSVNFGNRGPANTSAGDIEFSTTGISLGIDRRLRENLVVGAGVGFARDKTEIGTDGSKSIAKGVSVAVYGSYQPTRTTFIDALIGVGTLNFDNERFVAPINGIAKLDRDGTQIFGSLAAGYEARHAGMLVSPYGRIDVSRDRLKDGTETGVGNFALHYFGQRETSVQASLGLRLESAHPTSFGWMAPRARLELRHSFDGDQLSQIAYADQLAGQRFSISSAAIEKNAIVLGFGGDFHLRGGLSLGVDYQLQKSYPQGTSQGFRFRVTQALDGKGARRASYAAEPAESGGAAHHDSSDVRFDAGFIYDDNVSRGRLRSEVLHDTNFTLSASRTEIFPINDNLRVFVVGSLGGDKFDRYKALDRLFASVRGELQYRGAADFGSPILAAFGRLTGEQFDSKLRRGYRASVGVSARQPLTDRILLFASLAHNERFAKSDVFDTRDNALQLNFDYALSNESTLYIAGEHRRGDIVSSGRGSLENIDIAKVLVVDDAFTATQTFAYKLEANTNILTLGYNLSFGTRDSLDISWRRARSNPRLRPGFDAPGPFNYIVDQFSVVYLLRF